MKQDRNQNSEKEEAPVFQLDQIKGAVIFGAGHGIGYALVERLVSSTSAIVHATYRTKSKAQNLFDLQKKSEGRLYVHHLDPLDESQLSELASTLEIKTPKLDLIINSIGLLHDGELQPERKLSELNKDTMSRVFQVNAIITPLIAKHSLKNKRSESPTRLFAAISAKVGSLSDNRLGGWYAYRASKAALNMFLKNIALELKRHRDNTVVLAIHPGTTETELSKPFIQKTNLKLHTPQETAENILKLIDRKGLNKTGQFYSWNGEELPW